MKLKLLFLCLCLYAGIAKAADFTGWRITGPIYSGSTVYVPASGSQVNYEVYFTRYDQETNIQLKFSIGTIKSNGDIVILSEPTTVTEDDFEAYMPLSLYLRKEFSVNINSSQIHNNRLYLFKYSGSQPVEIPGSYATTDQLPSQGSNELFTGTPIPFPAHFKSTYYQYNVVRTQLGSGTRIEIKDDAPVLTPGQAIYSPNGNYKLILQSAGNIVLYKKNSNGSDSPIWANNSTVRFNTVASVRLQQHGNLVAYKYNGTPDWGSEFYDYGGSTLRYSSNQYQPNSYAYPFFYLEDSGQLVEYWPATLKDPNHPNDTSYEVYVIVACSDTPLGDQSNHYNFLTPNLWHNTWTRFGTEFH